MENVYGAAHFYVSSTRQRCRGTNILWVSHENTKDVRQTSAGHKLIGKRNQCRNFFNVQSSLWHHEIHPSASWIPHVNFPRLPDAGISHKNAWSTNSILHEFYMCGISARDTRSAAIYYKFMYDDAPWMQARSPRHVANTAIESCPCLGTKCRVDGSTRRHSIRCKNSYCDGELYKAGFASSTKQNMGKSRMGR